MIDRQGWVLLGVLLTGGQFEDQPDGSMRLQPGHAGSLMSHVLVQTFRYLADTRQLFQHRVRLPQGGDKGGAKGKGKDKKAQEGAQKAGRARLRQRSRRELRHPTRRNEWPFLYRPPSSRLCCSRLFVVRHWLYVAFVFVYFS